MRRTLAVTAALVLLAFSGTALAQDSGGGGEDDTRSKFYDFNDMLVDGQLKTPDVQRTEARGQAKFKRLLDLKKSFLPKVQESTDEAALE
ncbi:MAG: hypothetical protein ABEL76_12735 [Bradymonadaceae bacterium]